MKDETLDKVISAAWRIALTILAPFLAVVASTYLIPDWLADSISAYPLQLVTFGVLAVAVGTCIGIVAGAAIAGIGKKKSEDRLAAIREAEETKRASKAEEEATKRARIEAESKERIAVMEQERADKMNADAKEQAEARAERTRTALYEKIANMPAAQMALIQKIFENGGVYETSQKDTVAFALKSVGVLSDLPIADASRAHWKLSEEADDILRNNNAMQRLIEDSAYRFRQEALRDEFERLSYIQKLFIYLLYLSDVVDTTWKVYSEADKTNFMFYSVVGKDKRRYRIKEAAKEMLDNNPALLEFCDPDGEKIDWLKGEIASLLGLSN